MEIIGAASENHRKQMKMLGEFCMADQIEYEDKDTGEDYIITRGVTRFVLKIRSNNWQGGFLALDTGAPPITFDQLREMENK